MKHSYFLPAKYPTYCFSFLIVKNGVSYQSEFLKELVEKTHFRF